MITGVVRSESGELLPGRSVRAVPFDPSEMPPGISGHVVRADDKGEFRVFGLPPGDYRVGVSSSSAELRERDQNGEERTVIELPAYYSNASREIEASRVSVRAGEEQGGINLTVKRGRTTTITGSIDAADATALTGLSVYGVQGGSDSERLTAAMQGTKFTLSRVTAGEYVVAARGGRPLPNRVLSHRNAGDDRGAGPTAFIQ